MANDRRMSEIPRSPEHHDLTGTGSPRSADDGRPQEGSFAHFDNEADPAVTVAKRTTSQPAHADEALVNRSGSGGSGGPATPDPSVEGSTGQSMSELLSGEDDEEPQAG
ncbi:MAG TPA: hypothetical protein VM305_01855 [Candidatus Limnocylindrales bacterium]|nr:hypothetical protein [Candidatus Limnocylindrales bacterium]